MGHGSGAGCICLAEKSRFISNESPLVNSGSTIPTQNNIDQKIYRKRTKENIPLGLFDDQNSIFGVIKGIVR